MKNVIKKIAATAMAFSLLGTGTAVTKTIAPQAVNTTTASAANGYPGTRYDGHAHGQFVENKKASYVYDHTTTKYEGYILNGSYDVIILSPGIKVKQKRQVQICRICGEAVKTTIYNSYCATIAGVTFYFHKA